MTEKAEMELIRALGRIEGKIDALYPMVREQRAAHDALEVRTRLLENWKWYLAGLFSLSLIASVVGVVISVAP